MNPIIRLQLLNNRPKVELNGEDIHIPDSSLDLLIYLAVENQSEYDRDELTRRLYESLDGKESLRKTALWNLNKEIKSLCIRHAPPNILGYDNSHVIVDVHEFLRLAASVSEIKSLAAYKLISSQLLTAINLYQDHFLNGYIPALYGLNPWIREKQAALRELFHSLLEKLVQYEIVAGRYNQALACAERWHRSLPEDELPLQYLIWLATNLDSYAMTLNYFNKLDELGSSRLHVIGYSPNEWRRLLARGMKPDVSVLRLNDVARIEVYNLVEIASQRLTGRDSVLEELFELLFVTRNHSLLTITGERGIGKTALAEAVTDACQKAAVVDRVIHVGVTSESNFEQVLNAIALQVNKSHLLDLNYRNKYLSIEQLFEAEDDLMILDQQEVGDVFSEDFKARVKALSECVTILVCCHEAWEEVHNISLGALDFGAARSLFSNYVENENFETDAGTLLTVTGGSPLAIKLFMRGMKTRNLSLREAMSQILEFSTDTHSGDTSIRYNRLLHWCWRLLDPAARLVLASLKDFDLLEGASLDELRNLHDDLQNTTVDRALQQLDDMALIELISYDGIPHYRWHSLLQDFLLEMNALLHVSDDLHFKPRLRERFCSLYINYLSRYTDDYPMLDIRQNNLLNAFNLGFEQGIVTLPDVNRLLPYLLARGLYHSARQIMNQAAQLVTSSIPFDHIELLLNAARLDMKQGEYQAAEQQLNKALTQAQESNELMHQSDIYHQLGNIVKMRGQYELSNQFHESALHFARKSQNQKLVCMILANLGATAVERGDYVTAKRHFEESLSLAESVKQWQVIEFTHTALGVIANEQLNFELALEYLTKAQVIARQIGNPERQAYIYLNSGASCYYLKQYEEARTHLESGLDIAQRLQHEELTANFTRNLGRIDAVKGDLLKAEHHYKRALMVAMECDLKRLATSILLDIGKISFQTHNWDYARACFKEVLEQSLELPNYDLAAEALFGLGITTAASVWIIGHDSTEKTVQIIADSEDARMLAQLPELPIRLEQLRKAEFLFQSGMLNFPDIHRYRVAEALANLIGTGDKK